MEKMQVQFFTLLYTFYCALLITSGKNACYKAQGFGFVNKGTEALSFRQVYGCFFRVPASQRIKGCLWI